ncbi:family 1 glycosylhydrolase [Bombiscardovia coagulans]|uniref:beta-glucosidase n=1 Tax=Bombiscardovia coagulans TaxID=686666 RepID=A0A261EST6_9BIFI|nr:family 1 glycosylhydrolase [Bombiscardovia coagulans]OZG49932.1 beta-glucosidase [Bombiscardovia coagulans]
MLENLHFPEGFIWGASTAAHQIEGNNVNNNWWAREHAVATDIKEPSGDACDSYHRYKEDISLLADSGLTMYRFSVEWARIEPEEGYFSRAELLHYRRIVEFCWEQGVEPMITLHHFTVPNWFAAQGGWRNPNAPNLFSRYVGFLQPLLDGVTWICTINEPNMVAMTQGGETGEDMVASSLPEPNVDIAHTISEAHHKARALLKQDPAKKVGWSVAAQAFHAMPGCENETQDYAYWRETFFFEQAVDDDWIGVQAYLRTFIGKHGPLPVPDDVEKTKNGWEYFPPALGIGVKTAWKLTGGKPVFVTENGIATDNDSRRIDYTYGALASLLQEMEGGVTVLGYLHWSLLDNYEWGSFSPTFGLVAVDRTTFERLPKPSLAWLGKAARTGVVTATERLGPDL